MTKINVEDFQLTEIRELPGVLKGDKLFPLPVELGSLSTMELQNVAEAMGGVLSYVKVRTTYTALENMICTAKGCYNPVGERFDGSDSKFIKCRDHAKIKR
jgi:hypothetical protein